MSPDLLQQSLTQVEQFCKQHNIAIVYGEIHEIEDVDVRHDERQPGTGVEQMLTLAQHAGVRLLNVEREENDLVIDEEKLQDWLAELDQEEDQADVLSDVALVRQQQGQLVRVALSFFYQGGLYRFEQSAQWVDAYESVYEALYGQTDDNDDEEEDEDVEEEESTPVESADEKTNEPPKDRDRASASLQLQGETSSRFAAYAAIMGERDTLSQATIEEQARLLIGSEKYLRAKTKTERRSVAAQLLQQQGFAFMRERWSIQDKAEELYQDEVVPRLEQAIIEKIKAYQAAGANPTMAGAARLLNLDVRRVGRYWEKAKE